MGGEARVRLGILGPLLVADDQGREFRVTAARQRVLLATADVELVAVVAQLRGQVRRVERENRNLHHENEVLREAAYPLIHQAPARERFAFIRARRDRFSVKLLCTVLVTDRGSYYAWVRAQGKRRACE
jgi:hypothetical protein